MDGTLTHTHTAPIHPKHSATPPSPQGGGDDVRAGPDLAGPEGADGRAHADPGGEQAAAGGDVPGGAPDLQGALPQLSPPAGQAEAPRRLQRPGQPQPPGGPDGHRLHQPVSDWRAGFPRAPLFPRWGSKVLKSTSLSSLNQDLQLKPIVAKFL